jgi:hypothetical protein
MAGLPEVLLQYRAHLDSECHTHYVQLRHAVYRALQEARRRRGLDPAPAPPPSPSPHESPTYRIWGWWALKAGHVTTARKHARMSVKQAPLSLESWKLLYCAIRGH